MDQTLPESSPELPVHPGHTPLCIMCGGKTSDAKRKEDGT